MTLEQELRAKALELSILRCNNQKTIASSFVLADYYLRFLNGESGEDLDEEIDERNDFHTPESTAYKNNSLEINQNKNQT